MGIFGTFVYRIHNGLPKVIYAYTPAYSDPLKKLNKKMNRGGWDVVESALLMLVYNYKLSELTLHNVLKFVVKKGGKK